MSDMATTLAANARESFDRLLADVVSLPPFVGPLLPPPAAPTTPQEKWNRMNRPQCVADYALGMSLDEIREVPDAVAEVRSWMPAGVLSF